MRQGSELRYLHWNHLGSTVMETSAAGSILTDQKHYPFGKQRDASPVTTDHRFTGQKQDESGLYYYNARYYDPEIGHFISPDTIVPDPGSVFGYNRYMYAMGNPLKFSDPSGHCISLSDLGEDPIRDMENDSACWTQVDGILYSAWDQDPTYWEKRYTSKDIFERWVAATSSNDTEFFQHERQSFHEYQDAEQHRLDFLSAKYGNDIYVPWDEPQPCGDIWDCQAIGYDLAALGGNALATASLAGALPSGGATLAGTAGGVIINQTATAAAVVHTAQAYENGDASQLDVWVVSITAVANPFPVIGIISGIGQLTYDVIIDPLSPQ